MRALVRACPSCHEPGLLERDACVRCGGRWFAGGRVDREVAGRLGPLRRLVGKGPLTRLNCADCRQALKSLDVPGAFHEGDLFWGLETARPAGTCVAEACARCGGVFVDAHNLARAGGERAFMDNLARVAMQAS